MEEWTPPTSFDEYRIIRPLGRGGMGQVFLGHDILLDRPVALKFILGLEPDQTRCERFIVEGRAIARLAHPNVVAVFRVGEIDEHPYLVTEYLRGSSLDRLEKPLPWPRVLRIGLGLARGLAAAHRQGILHRDLKPANAILAEDGEVKLLDFGLAKFVPQEHTTDPDDLHNDTATAQSLGPSLTEPERITRNDRVLGTPLYMSPETLRGEPATRRSDVYALGAMLYELCSGATVRPRGRLVDPKDAQPQPLLQVSPDVEPRLAVAIDRCIQNDPAHRFASADELVDALLPLTPENNAVVVPMGNPYRGLRPFEGEHRSLFFGRDSDIRAVLERVRGESLVIVAGDSGVGKSSLCKAGVLPMVEEGTLGFEVRVRRMVPGRRPITALAAVLSTTLETNEEALAAWIRSDPAALARALQRHRQRRPGQALLIFIDQLEELFTLCDAEEARLFGEVLAHLCTEVPANRVLATVRGDFFTRLASLPGLGTEAARALYLLRPLGQEQIRESITGPARRKGVTFESEEMVESLVASASRAAAGLPLLQFALAELWDARDLARSVIPAAALERNGGVEGALARHADEVLARLLPEQRLAARRLLLRLVTVEGTRARKPAAELLAGDVSAQSALEALVQGRLLVAREDGGAITIEVAHEALLRAWGTLREWLEVDGDRRVLRQRLETAAAEWERLGWSGDLLWQRTQLLDAQRLDQVDIAERERRFLSASRSAQRHRAWSRRIAFALIPLLVVAAFLLVRLRDRVDMRSRVAAAVAAASPDLQKAQAANKEALEGRDRAFAIWESQRDWTPAERLWKQVLAAEAEVGRSALRASTLLEAAEHVDPGDPAVRRALLEAMRLRLDLAVRTHDDERADEYRARLLRLGGVQPLAPSHLVIEAPPMLRVNLVEHRPSPDAGGPRLTDHLLTVGAPLELASGAALLAVTASNQEARRVPVLLEAGRETRLVFSSLPPPHGFIEVPAGRFLFGSADPEAIRAAIDGEPPLHVAETGAYLIARDEVTVGEWIEFLDSLPERERALRTPGIASFGAELRLSATPRGWRFWLKPTSVGFGALFSQPFLYRDRRVLHAQDWRRFPVGAISAADAEAYAQWLRATGRLKDARLCDEKEWVRAARGADGRLYTTGQVLSEADANFDETYGRLDGAYGPDEVGSHPASDSPWGVRDLMGNVQEIVTSVGGPAQVVTRGGSWFQDRWSTRIANRTPLVRDARAMVMGLRLCSRL